MGACSTKEGIIEVGKKEDQQILEETPFKKKNPKLQGLQQTSPGEN